MISSPRSAVHLCWSLLGLCLWLAGCAPAQAAAPASLPPAPSATLPPSPSPRPTQTASPTEFPALTLVFYGDSLLKVGEVGRQGQSGVSFVDVLSPYLQPSSAYTLIFANYGGRKARWAAQHLQETVLIHDPDIVTIWWGMNDLDGCPGIFDRESNRLIEYKLRAYVEEHSLAMRKQIDDLLAEDIQVFVLSAMPVLGGNLPWSHRGPNGEVIWEEGRWCHYNLGLEQLAQGQRQLAAEYAAAGAPVFWVDVWELYMQNRQTERMYMDVVHPGTQGAALIAQAWMDAFNASGIR